MDALTAAAWTVLSTVEDPELGLDIVSLGLVYTIEREEKRVRVVYTLTSMGCPIGPMIERDIVDAVGGLDVHSIWDASDFGGQKALFQGRLL